MSFRIGIDVGGTFTDCAVFSEHTGDVRTVKVPTTPHDESTGFLEAVAKTGVPLDEVSLVVHGCTVGLNAALTRSGARIGLLTTEGFRDVPAMGRGQRPSSDQFNPFWVRRFSDGGQPFVPRYLRRGIKGRLDHDGNEVVPLDLDNVREQLAFLRSQDVEAVAICLLNSYANDAHEREVEALLRAEAPELYCWRSTSVHPCFKEYPRFSTCVLNTYVGPLLDRYLDKAERLLEKRGYPGPLMMMQSNGGVLSASMTRERPAYTLQSGPTGGVMAAKHWGGHLGLDRLLTLDIGGTSADYAIISDGEPVVTTELEIEHDVLVALPAVNVHSVGSGGGSIAWIDRVGALRVGPRSAGARPGPACYGRGGTEPTVTDALAVTGILQPAQFLDGELTLHPDRAREALAPITAHLGVDPERAAAAVIDVAVANMVEAAREVSVYNGIDPRDFALYIYGAAGPIFASRIGRELGVDAVVVPPFPGELSAYGLAMADMRLDLGAPVVQAMDGIDPVWLCNLFDEMEQQARDLLGDEDVTVLRWIDGRYNGQTWETPSVPVPAGPLDAERLDEVMQNFHRTHRQVWGYDLARFGVKVTMARVTAIGATGARPASQSPWDGEEQRGEPATVEVFIDGGRQSIPCYQRSTLASGTQLAGPALVTQPTTTILLMPGDTAEIDETGHLWIHMSEEQSE